MATFLRVVRTPEFTHFQGSSHARLDGAHVAIDLLPLCTRYDVKHVSSSDHGLVCFTIGTKDVKSSFSWDFWKPNIKILEDDVFQIEVKTRVQKLREAEPEKAVEASEHFKQEIKIAAIERSCTRRRDARKKEKELQCDLNFALSLEAALPGKYATDITEIKSKLQVIADETYMGAVVRARAERLLCSEAPTKQTMTDEKGYATKKKIKQIRYRDAVTHDSDLIQQAFIEYYSELLGQNSTVEEGFDDEFLRLMPKLEHDVAEAH